MASFENDIHVLVGLADTCELMEATLRFPTEDLAQALIGGAYSQDALSCLRESGLASDKLSSLGQALSSFDGRNHAQLVDVLKKGYSLLFLAPGSDVPVWPYEAAFRFVASGKEGIPSLFRSPITMDVERLMRAAGVFPRDARTEPADSVWDEFSYLSFLFGSSAQALSKGDETAAQAWVNHARTFWNEHARVWFEPFFMSVQERAPQQSYGVEYGVLAQVGLAATLVLESVLKS